LKTSGLRNTISLLAKAAFTAGLPAAWTVQIFVNNCKCKQFLVLSQDKDLPALETVDALSCSVVITVAKS